MLSELDYTKAQLVFFYIIVLLSLDVLNPVKIVYLLLCDFVSR